MLNCVEKKGIMKVQKYIYVWKNYKEEKFQVNMFVLDFRVFDFKNNISNLDNIFNRYEAIINYGIPLVESKIAQYSGHHIGKLMEEIEVIMKANFTEYYQTSIKSVNSHNINYSNIFYYEKKDFIKYEEFVFGILLEFDRRHQLRNDDDNGRLIFCSAYMVDLTKQIIYKKRYYILWILF